MGEYLKIARLVWPLALGMMNNAIMQFVDRAYLSGYSLSALEAVLPAGMLMWIFAGFFQAVVGYSSVFVGLSHGAGDKRGSTTAYRAALWLALAASIVSIPLIPVGEWALSFSSISGEGLAFAKDYYAIVMGGTFAIYGQMAASAYFTGLGRTRVVLWVNVLGNIFNIALDPILIFVLDMGIAGAAWATVVAAVMQMLFLYGLAEFDVRKRGRGSIGGKAVMVKILRFGTPSGLYSVVNCLSFTIFVFVTGGVGEFELAVSNACFTVNYFLFAPMEGFALGASTLVAQAIGAKDIPLARRSARKTVFMGVALAAICSLAAVVFAHPILSVFAMKAGERAEDFIALGKVLFLVMAAWQIFDAADIVLSGALKGAGDTKFVMGWMCVCVLLWLPMVFVVKQVHNTMPALWSTQIVYVVLIFVGSLVRWHRGSWERRLTG